MPTHGRHHCLKSSTAKEATPGLVQSRTRCLITILEVHPVPLAHCRHRLIPAAPVLLQITGSYKIAKLSARKQGLRVCRNIDVATLFSRIYFWENKLDFLRPQLNCKECRPLLDAPFSIRNVGKTRAESNITFS